MYICISSLSVSEIMSQRERERERKPYDTRDTICHRNESSEQNELLVLFANIGVP